jgi:hypothetical protein
VPRRPAGLHHADEAGAYRADAAEAEDVALEIFSNFFIPARLEFGAQAAQKPGVAMDLIYLALAVGFFAVTAALVPLFEKLRRR